jgi:hypothetical protein
LLGRFWWEECVQWGNVAAELETAQQQSAPVSRWLLWAVQRRAAVLAHLAGNAESFDPPWSSEHIAALEAQSSQWRVCEASLRGEAA